jgi:hypothetical protein
MDATELRHVRVEGIRDSPSKLKDAGNRNLKTRVSKGVKAG